jgi:uncharacterized membrane protein YesL
MTRRPADVDSGWRRRFAFFAECVIVGLAVTLTGAFIVTLPAALAAGSAYLRTWSAGEQATLASFGRTFLVELRRLWVVSVLWVVATLVVIGEVVVVVTMQLPLPLPGLIGAALVILGVFAQLVMLRLVTLGELEGALPEKLRTASAAVVLRPRGSALLFVALVMCAVLVWQLPPLLVPALGMLALAVASVRTIEARGAIRAGGEDAD